MFRQNSSWILLAMMLLFEFILPVNEKENSMIYTSVADNVVLATPPAGSNIVCVSAAEGLYFIDTGLNTEFAAKFRRDMEEKFNQPAKALILTHAHFDHFLGMGAFIDLDIMSLAAGKDLFEKQLAINFTEARIQAYEKVFATFTECIKTAKLKMPTIFIKSCFKNSDCNLEFSACGGHTSCSGFVYLKKEGILIAGDLIQEGQYPYFGDPTTDMSLWLKTLSLWESWPITAVCPGHGRVVDKNYVVTMKNYFISLLNVLSEFKKQQLPIEQVVSHSQLPAGYWPQNLKRPAWFDYCLANLYKKL